MRHIRIALTGLFLLSASQAQAANSTVSAMTAASAFGGTELAYIVQGAADRKGTVAQFATYTYSLASGDCTITGPGVVTCLKTNGAAFTALATTAPGTAVATALGVNVGTAGSVVVNGGVLGTPSSGVGTNLTGTAAGLTAGNVTTNANLTGAVTSVGNAASLGSFTSANLFSALTTKTGSGGSAVFATGPTMSSVILATAAQLSYITGSTQCLHVDTSGNITGTGSDCGSGGSGISSLTPGSGALVSSTTTGSSQTAITTSGTLYGAEIIDARTTTSETINDTDRGKLVTGTNSSAQAYTIAQAGASTTFQSGWFTRVQNKGTGALVITPTTSTICGASTLTIQPGQTQKITSDGTNYQCDGGTTGSLTVSSQAGANYPFVVGNFGQLVNLSNASPQAPTLPVATTAGFTAGWYVGVCNQGAGIQTITPTTSTIGGAASYPLGAGSAKSPTCITIVSDGTNYQVVPETLVGTVTGALKASTGGVISQAACADLSNGATGCSTATGTSGATIPLLNGTNTFSGAQTFGEVIGTVTTQSGTTYTLAATDCGTTVRGSNASAITFTIPQGLPIGCNISIEQALAGAVSVNGSAVTPATLHSAHSYTKTSAQWAIINVFIETSNVAILTGDGA